MESLSNVSRAPITVPLPRQLGFRIHIVVLEVLSSAVPMVPCIFIHAGQVRLVIRVGIAIRRMTIFPPRISLRALLSSVRMMDQLRTSPLSLLTRGLQVLDTVACEHGL